MVQGNALYGADGSVPSGIPIIPVQAGFAPAVGGMPPVPYGGPVDPKLSPMPPMYPGAMPPYGSYPGMPYGGGGMSGFMPPPGVAGGPSSSWQRDVSMGLQQVGMVPPNATGATPLSGSAEASVPSTSTDN